MGKNPNTFAKRQREMEKKRKAEDKRKRKREKKDQLAASEDEPLSDAESTSQEPDQSAPAEEVPTG